MAGRLSKRICTREPSLSKASTNLISGVKPVRSRTKKACHHGPTNTFTVQTPIGDMAIVSCPKGIHAITQSPELKDSDFTPDKGCSVELKSQLYSDNGYTYAPTLQSIRWLKDYFNKEHNEQVPAICPSVSTDGSFAAKVWQTLIGAAPFGKTISYKALSAALGNVSASRAVGQAMANNPIMLVVPCHRVIKSDGTAGNYAHGRRNSVKQWLLKFERGEV